MIDKNSDDKCVRCVKKLSAIGLWDSFFLAIFKGVVGILTHSRALTMSAIYSFHDVISSLVVILGLRVAESPKDQSHPYGYGKMEYVISLFTSIVIFSATVFFLIDSTKVFLSGEHSPPHWAAFGAALISVFVNEIIYRYNICSYRRLNSPALLTHAKHHRADAIASGAVVLAVVGAKMGFHFLDTFVALFEAMHLMILSGEIIFSAITGLMDRSVDGEILTSIRSVVSQAAGSQFAGGVRARQTGRTLSVDLHLNLPDEITVSDAQRVSDRILSALRRNIRHVGEVNIVYD